MATREYIAILCLDEETASRCDKVNGFDDTSPGDYLEREFGWLNESGIYLDDWALVDDDIKWECYTKYLVNWAIAHNSDEYYGMSPASFEEWHDTEGRRY